MAHLFAVDCTVATPHPAGQAFRLPTWIPGSYLIREFAKNVVRIAAQDANGPVRIAKEAKDLWRAAPCAGPLTVSIEVYAFDCSVRTAYLDATRGFFNGTSVFLCPEGLGDAPCEVEIVRPEGGAFASWRVATSLPRLGAPEFGFGTYRADDYATLVDHPVEIADFTLGSFEAGGVPHLVAISGRHRTDMARLTADLQRICEWQCRLFDPDGGKAPFDQYVFLVAAVGDGYGGLEHRASTALLCKRHELPQPGMDKVTDDYRTFLGLASHEYFHAWNVKRIRPVAFAPYELVARGLHPRPVGLRGNHLVLRRPCAGEERRPAGVRLAGASRAHGHRRHARPGPHAAERGRVELRRLDQVLPRRREHPQRGGELLRQGIARGAGARSHASPHGASLDAVMRALWERYGKADVGVPEGTIAGLATELAGRPLDDFFARYVDGTEDPPLADLLRRSACASRRGRPRGPTDRGGKPAKDVQRCWLGLKLASGAEARVQHVLSGSPAERAGLAAGDTLVALDGLRATPDSLDRLLRQRQPGDALTLHAFRRDELLTLRCTLAAAPQDTYWLTLAPDADEEARARRAAWLGAAGEDATAARPD